MKNQPKRIYYHSCLCRYEGHWIMDDTALELTTSSILQADVKKQLSIADANVILRGVISLGQSNGRNRSPQFERFEEAWYSQPSTAKMHYNGSRTDCSDARDITGYYIWREDGREDGRCFGIGSSRRGNVKTES